MAKKKKSSGSSGYRSSVPYSYHRVATAAHNVVETEQLRDVYLLNIHMDNILFFAVSRHAT